MLLEFLIVQSTQIIVVIAAALGAAAALLMSCWVKPAQGKIPDCRKRQVSFLLGCLVTSSFASMLVLVKMYC